MENLKRNQKKLTWNQIAILLHENNTNTSKTGKQCRERWTNQINPQVKRFTQWSKEENQTLFSMHKKLGNKWSEISQRLPGRTDNCIKNHFYSVMRGGLRKINLFIENVKRKQVLVKTFKNEILNKILTICQGKSNEKFQLSIQAQQLALIIKENLVLISLDETQESPETLAVCQNLYNQICEFARNCRRKKSKKVNESNFYSEDSSEKEKKKKKTSQLHMKKEFENDNEENEDSFKGNQFEEIIMKQNELISEINNSFGENQQSSIPKQGNFSLKSELKQSENNFFGARSDYQINQIEKNDKPFHVEQPKLLGSVSYNFPIPLRINSHSNSNFFNFGNINVEGSQDWARNSGLFDNKNTITGFINTVPDVSNKNFEFESENKKGELDFSNYNNLPIPSSELESIFKKEINSIPISDIAKSYDLDKSFTFSSSLKQSPMFLQVPSQTSRGDVNLQALFSSSSFLRTPLPLPLHQLTNSSGFSMWSGFEKESQEIKLKSTKCDLEDEKGENKGKDEVEDEGEDEGE